MLPGADIDLAVLPHMDRFLQDRCVSGTVSVERGHSQSNRHLQCIFKVLKSVFKTSRAFGDSIRRWLQDRKGRNIKQGNELVRISGVNEDEGLHTYVGMRGYVTKDFGEPWFQCALKGVTQAEIDQGREIYVRHGAAHKNEMLLRPEDMMPRVKMWWRYKLLCPKFQGMVPIVTDMVKRGHFMFSAQWVIPYRGGAMDEDRANAVCKSMMFPETITRDDVRKVLMKPANSPRYFDSGPRDVADGKGDVALHSDGFLGDMQERPNVSIDQLRAATNLEVDVVEDRQCERLSLDDLQRLHHCVYERAGRGLPNPDDMPGPSSAAGQPAQQVLHSIADVLHDLRALAVQDMTSQSFERFAGAVECVKRMCELSRPQKRKGKRRA